MAVEIQQESQPESPAEVAYRDSLESRLVVHSAAPLNAEVPLELLSSAITPTQFFFHRNRFPCPATTATDWLVQVSGAVERSLTLTYDSLVRMPARTLVATLECAGNGRTAFSPPTEGEQWNHGAVSTAEWTGVPLRFVLDAAGLLPGVCEIVFTGADTGSIPGGEGPIRFARCLPVDQAIHPDTLVAYEMNAEPLPAAHGYPVRLVVPGWYGMASVKWLTGIETLKAPFTGYFQSQRYVIPAENGGTRPVTHMLPRSLIVSPADGATLTAGRTAVRGQAWSGHGPIEVVEVSIDGGSTWKAACFTSPAMPYVWRSWESRLHLEPGVCEIRCRATDVAGNSQPMTAPWNRLGYENNSIHSIRVRCHR